MKGSALGFTFVVVILVAFSALLTMSASVGFFVGLLPFKNLVIVIPVAAILVFLNASIVYGLRRNKIWAVITGASEITVLLILQIVQIWFEGLSSILGSLFYISLLIALLYALYRDYQLFQHYKAAHV